MDITPLIPANAKIIQSINDQTVKVSGTSYALPIIITPSAVIEWDGSDVEKMDAEVILIGTGSRFEMPDMQTRQAFKNKGLKAEWMDNKAAARTYNVLMSEGRMVAAALK